MEDEKRKLVVQVRKPAKRKIRRIHDATRSAPGNCGLPSFSTIKSPPHRVMGKAADDGSNDTTIERVDPVQHVSADLFDENNDEDAIPSETFMVFTSLLSDPNRAIAVPMSNTNDCIYGILPCQLHALLDHDDGSDATVSLELQQLLQSRELCRLRLSSSKSTHVLLLRSDYCRAVESISRSFESRSSDQGCELDIQRHILDWFLTSNSIMDTVNESDLESRWQSQQRRTSSSKVSSLPFAKVLSILQQEQVLRVCDTSTNHRSAFQLWLPHWGVVVHAWQRGSTQLLAQLERSHYKERSVSALVQSNRRCPIPVQALLEALVSQGEVVRVQRPSGMFVKLAA